MRHHPTCTLAALVCAACSAAAQHARPAPTTDTLPTIAQRTKGVERREGFVPAYVDPGSGALWLEFPKAGTRLLQCVALAAGLGSNPIRSEERRVGKECRSRGSPYQ